MIDSISNHAKIRFRQRGINEKVVDYLKKYGNATHAPGGAIKFTLTRRKANKIISDLKIVGDARGILTFVFTFNTKSSCHAKLA